MGFLLNGVAGFFLQGGGGEVIFSGKRFFVVGILAIEGYGTH